MKRLRLTSRLRTRLLFARDPVAYARALGVTVGVDCRFLGSRPGTFGSEPFLISIGDHVTITGDVQFVTHDGGVWVFRSEYPDIDVFGAIRIGSNVFIGYGALLMPGVTVGDNCVIGAGSIVSRDIPANTLAVGSPAHPISTIDEYRARILPKAVHVRSMAAEEKRALLQNLLRD